MASAYIVEALRTPGGRARKGGLVDVHPADLGATVVDALVTRSGIDPSAIDDVIVGCVSQAGEQSFAFARNIVPGVRVRQSLCNSPGRLPAAQTTTASVEALRQTAPRT